MLDEASWSRRVPASGEEIRSISYPARWSASPIPGSLVWHDRGCGVNSLGGGVRLAWWHSVRPEHPEFDHPALPTGSSWFWRHEPACDLRFPVLPRFQRVGFAEGWECEWAGFLASHWYYAAAYGDVPPPTGGSTVVVADWFLLVLFAVAPVRWALKWNRRRRLRRASGRLCPACGYDLRATPEEDGPLLGRCPECGQEVEGGRPVKREAAA